MKYAERCRGTFPGKTYDAQGVDLWNPGRSLLDIVAIKQDLEDLMGCAVDVVTEAAISPYIREEVLREAVSL
jgi:predicted nucleotidyltransferase